MFFSFRSLLPVLALLGFFLLPTAARSDMTARDVDLRIDTFDEIDRLFKALRFKVVNQRSDNRKGAMVYSRELARLSYRLPALFDEPSPREMYPQSRARPEIWSRKARYDFLLDEFLDNLEMIHEHLEKGQMSQAGQLIDQTAQSCRRCHNTFRYR